MGIEHPKIGETQRGKDIGKPKGQHRRLFIWHPCQYCNIPRWVLYRNNTPQHLSCRKCGNKIGHTKLKRIKNTGTNSLPPQINEIRRGFELGKTNTTSERLYIYLLCPNCHTAKWFQYENSRSKHSLCFKCSHIEIGKKSKGIRRNNRPLITHAPLINEIRYGNEIGRRASQKYQYVECPDCKKTRWICYPVHNKRGHRCQPCAQIGLIQKSSISNTRKCLKCHNTYPATRDYFYKDSKSLLGITKTCRQCKMEINRKKSRKKMSTPQGKISNAMSCRIRESLTTGKGGKHWESIVGYTLEELIQHLESQFKDGMNWSNYGNKTGMWSIDHIIPISAHCYRSIYDRDFKRCWGLSNLRPLYHIDNMRKHDKVYKPFQPSLPLGINERKATYAINT
jgi:hypothetical protein